MAAAAIRIGGTASQRVLRLVQGEDGVSTKVVASAILGHVLIGVLAKISPAFTYAHMMATIVIGFWMVLSSKGRPERAAYVAAYFAGSEVLWRMAMVSLFWEFGKYGSAAVMLIALAQMNRRKPHFEAATYFLLLMPAAVITYWTLGFTVGRHPLSFNLSGPFSLAVAVWYFSNLTINFERLQRLFLSFACGAVAIGSAVLYSVATAQNIHFTNGSNPETSGGYGPNQVAAILALGALLLVFYLIMGSTKTWTRTILFCTAVFLSIQSALTFSRGGLVDSLLAFLVATPFLIRERSYRNRVAPLLIGSALAVFIALPQLESFTGGGLGRRFEDPSTTHRDEMVKAELALWGENPLFGSGVGLAAQARLRASHSSKVAHTEFSRLLAEHGSFGLGAILILLAMPVLRLRETTEPVSKAFVAWCSCWAFAFMASNAMRLESPSFVYGLMFVNWIPQAQVFRVRRVAFRSTEPALQT